MPSPSFEPDADAPMSHLAAHAVQIQLDRILRWGSSLPSRPTPREIHRLRVATRRFRTFAVLFRDWRPKSIEKEDLRVIRELADRLGEARDRDIAISRVEDFQSHLGSPPPAFLLALWNDERQTAVDAVHEFLRSAPCRSFLHRWDGNPLSPRSRGGRVKDEYPHLIEGIWREAAHRSRECDGARLEDLHRLRIRCKRLRYVMEAIQPYCGRLFARLIGKVIRVQDAFGAMCDDAMVERLVLDSFSSFSQDDILRHILDHARSGIRMHAEKARQEAAGLFRPTHHATLLSAMAALQKQKPEFLVHKS